MLYKIIGYVCLIPLLLCGGCGINEGVLNKEPASFLRFTGNVQNAIAYIDNLDPIEIDKPAPIGNNVNENNNNRIRQTHYQISPGKHTIIIKKSGVEVVNRIILIGNGITKEIQIP
ncbi:MAG: hypothetical protein JRJ49_01400 [Deltaproteobacteria bacterium]|nr:hypothetical protein [Deltaproteobacteria bacterium]